MDAGAVSALCANWPEYNVLSGQMEKERPTIQSVMFMKSAHVQCHVVGEDQGAPHVEDEKFTMGPAPRILIEHPGPHPHPHAPELDW
jgi:hypothetical protein